MKKNGPLIKIEWEIDDMMVTAELRGPSLVGFQKMNRDSLLAVLMRAFQGSSGGSNSINDNAFRIDLLDLLLLLLLRHALFPLILDALFFFFHSNIDID